MKRILILALAVLSLAFTSCTKTYYEELKPQVVILNFPEDAWYYSNQDNNNYFYVTMKTPEISDNAFKNGMVKMYRVYDWNQKGATQVEMPYTNPVEVLVGDTWCFYTETVYYEFSPGEVTVYYLASDFDYEIDETFVPAGMTFRLVVYE